MTLPNKRCAAYIALGAPDRKLSIAAILLVCIGLPLMLFAHPAQDASQNDGQPAVRVPSDVAWTQATIQLASEGNAFRGSLLGKQCAHCHGSEGFSSEPGIPNLAGIDQLSTWKQLQDFRSGKRYSAAMQPIVSVFSSQDEADLASYFAMLPTFPDPQDNRIFPQSMPDSGRSRLAERLIVFGDAQRGIPPCDSCHGPIGYIKGSPSLATQNSGYLLEQLQHFADGTRHNDIDLTMRIIASQLTDEEKSAISSYYGAGRGPSAPRPDIP